MNKILFLIFLFSLAQSQELSFYFDRVASLVPEDYLIFYVKNQFADKKVYYKLPKHMDHKESFQVKICKEGTIQALSTKKINTLENNCLQDINNTIGEINYNEIELLQQRSIYDITKICDFGFALAEGERSFLNENIKTIMEKKDSEKDSLYYQNTQEIIFLSKAAQQMNWRQIFEQKEDMRCKLEYKNFQFIAENFQPKLFQQKNYNQHSYLIVEYNFPENYEFVKPKTEEFHQNLVNQNELNNNRQKVIQQLSKMFNLQKSEFEKYYLNFNIEENNSLQTIIMNSNYKIKNNFDGFLPQIKENQIYRFIPMLCNQVMEKKTRFSYEFIDEHKCDFLSKEKILFTRKNEKLKFIIKKQDKLMYTKSLHYEHEAMDFEIQDKVKDESITIQGFLNKCDSIFDREFNIFYYACFQQTTRTINGEKQIDRVLNISQNQQQYFILSLNNIYTEEHKQYVYGEFNQIMVGLGIVLMMIGIGTIFLNVFAGVLIVFGGLFLIILSYRKVKKFTKLKKQIYYNSQNTPYMLKNPETEFKILPVTNTFKPLPKGWNKSERQKIPDIGEHYKKNGPNFENAQLYEEQRYKAQILQENKLEFGGGIKVDEVANEFSISNSNLQIEEENIYQDQKLGLSFSNVNSKIDLEDSDIFFLQLIQNLFIKKNEWFLKFQNSLSFKKNLFQILSTSKQSSL